MQSCECGLGHHTNITALNVYNGHAEKAFNAAAQQEQALQQCPASPSEEAQTYPFTEVTEEQDAALMGPSFLSQSSGASSTATPANAALPAASQVPCAPRSSSLGSSSHWQKSRHHAFEAEGLAADPVPDAAAAAEAALWDAWEQEEAEAEAAGM